MKALRKSHKVILLTILAVGIGGTGAVALATKTSQNNEKKGDPSWVVVEDDFWGPLVYEPYDTFVDLQRNFSRNEMQAAAHELARARSWLLLAAEKAEPITKEKLQASAETLDKLGKDLSAGKTIEAAELRYAIATAKQSLAEWHYFKGREDLAKADESLAASHLQVAARYLRTAADDIRYSWPTDSVAWFESINGTGWDEVTVVGLPSNKIASNLDKLKGELDMMSTALTEWQHS